MWNISESELESETVLLPSRCTHTRNLLWCAGASINKNNKLEQEVKVKVCTGIGAGIV